MVAVTSVCNTQTEHEENAAVVAGDDEDVVVAECCHNK
jgi:hypothetical protein